VLEPTKLSIVIPCYNEEKTLEECVGRVWAIRDETLELELIIVDDCSNDKCLKVASDLAERVPGSSACRASSCSALKRSIRVRWLSFLRFMHPNYRAWQLGHLTAQLSRSD
jgi:glycosyltransferase involved in cell wall biosynthesis